MDGWVKYRLDIGIRPVIGWNCREGAIARGENTVMTWTVTVILIYVIDGLKMFRLGETEILNNKQNKAFLNLQVGSMDPTFPTTRKKLTIGWWPYARAGCIWCIGMAFILAILCSFFHFILRFWNQIFIWRSVKHSACAISILNIINNIWHQSKKEQSLYLRLLVRYLLKWNSFSSSSVWYRV